MTYVYNGRNKKEADKGIELSGNKCIVCSWNVCDKKGNLILHAAHVRPYNNAKEYDTSSNIIALCPNHHEEYDRLNFTINYKEKTIIHRQADNPFNGKKIVGKINHIKPSFFIYHNRLYSDSL